ncbi:sigma-54-dependent Fis family transcriptional regulator [Sphingobacteriaceae bacterium AH-315-L07]|nr:sigma-54-dependent Fis family transcriptional regulator [Sphingobacteriaceae bacterium AH-315-L07]
MVHPIITIFVIEDDLTFAKLIQASLEERNNNVNIVHYEDAEACLENIHQNPDLITIDHSLPGISGLELLKKVKDYNSNIKTVFISAQDQVNVVIEAFGTGADAYIEKGDNCIPLLVKNFENLISNISQKHEIENLREELISQHKYEEIKGNSPEILKVHAAIDKAIRSNMVIIITGESGTGKELVARAVHFNSDRKNKTFVAENMAAIPKELIKSYGVVSYICCCFH